MKMKRGKIVFLMILFMVAGAGACYLHRLRTHAAGENQEPVLEEGQEYAYAQITSILGNEIEYIILDAQAVDLNDLQEKGSGIRDRGSGEDVGGERQGTAAQGKKMPTGGGMPDMGSMPSGGGMPDMGKMPTGGTMPDIGGMPFGDTEGSGQSGIQNFSVPNEAGAIQGSAIVTYIETGETGQMQIPVGTEVQTKLGTITTFSRLSGGDIIKMLLQRDDVGDKVLMKIWIVE